MSEYTIKDVIIDPDDPRVEIGAEYIFGSSPTYLLERLNSGKAVFTKLKEVCPKSYEPFNPEMDSRSYPLCVPKKGSLYSERQRKWIVDNGIKLGDRVRVTRKADTNEDIWPNEWTTDMDKTAGKTLYVDATSRGDGIQLRDGKGFSRVYPYFVLEKVEPEYVPFDLSNEEDRAKLRGAWVREKGGERELAVTAIYLDERPPFVELNDNGFTAEELFEDFDFLDGTPCGKLEVEE